MIKPDNNDLYDLNEALKVENLTINDYEEICKRLERQPNRTELGMFGVMWSEHCCYRNSKPLLSQFPTKGKNVLVGPGENAGVIDVGNNQKLVFKIESHNHPSAIEPFQGAATGVGGILRDIFTMGARPIAVLNSLRFGNIDKPKNVDLLRGVVSGIAHYGNCVGVPTVGGEIDFDDSYSGNPLVNVMALGLLETNEIVCSGARKIGSPVLYVGNTTGRDGVGGASFASSELTSSSLDDRPAVQVGDPFIEKSLIEACLDAFKTGDVIAAQDMGAAGLTCSSAEMAANGNLGISIDLDLVPSRENNMSPYQYLLSESQERMLFVVKEEKVSELIEKLDVDEDLANTLISNGYNSLESISSSEIEKLSQIDGFDDDISSLLINRAKDALLTMAMEVSTDDGKSGDLMSVEGMEMTLALELTQKGINDREELAEQSIEELTSIIDISEEDAGDLIMRARAHWFED